jgi:hypothetical protein
MYIHFEIHVVELCLHSHLPVFDFAHAALKALRVVKLDKATEGIPQVTLLQEDLLEVL